MAKTGEGSGQTGRKKSDAVSLLKDEHRQIKASINAYGSLETDKQEAALRDVYDGWLRHSLIEEELFLTEAKSAGVSGDKFEDAEIERDMAKILLSDIRENEGEL